MKDYTNSARSNHEITTDSQEYLNTAKSENERNTKTVSCDTVSTRYITSRGRMSPSRTNGHSNKTNTETQDCDIGSTDHFHTRAERESPSKTSPNALSDAPSVAPSLHKQCHNLQCSETKSNLLHTSEPLAPSCDTYTAERYYTSSLFTSLPFLLCAFPFIFSICSICFHFMCRCGLP